MGGRGGRGYGVCIGFDEGSYLSSIRDLRKAIIFLKSSGWNAVHSPYFLNQVICRFA